MSPYFSELGGPKCTKFGEGILQSSTLKICFPFLITLSVSNLKGTGFENRGQIWDLKIRGGADEMSESIFRVTSVTQTLTDFRPSRRSAVWEIQSR